MEEMMAAQRNSLDALGRELSKAISPLETFLSSPEEARALLNLLGWELPPGVDDIGLTVTIGAVIDQLRVIERSTPEEQRDPAVMGHRYAELLAKVAKLVADIRAAADALSNALSSDYLNATKINERFAPRLLDYLVIRYMEEEHYRLYSLLVLIGIFHIEAKGAKPEIFQVEHVEHTVMYDRVGMLLSDPGGLANEAYGWGTADLDTAALLVNFARLLQAFGAELRPGPMSRSVEESLAGRSLPEADTQPMPRVVIDLIRGLGLDPLTVGLSVFGLRASGAGGTDGGIGLAPYVAGAAELVFPLSASGQAQLELEGSVASELGLALLVRPGGQFELKTFGSAVADIKVGLRVRWLPAPDQDRIVLVAAEGVGIDAADAFVELIGSPGGVELAVGISDGAISVRPSGDGFLSNVLPPEGLAAPFDLVLGWSSSGGLRMRGGAGLEATVQVSAQLGPLLIDSVYVGFRVAGSGLRVTVATSPSFSLGPFAAAVSRVGARLELSFPPKGGNLGPMQLDLGFNPPIGVGLAIDTPAVRGGGFLELDYDAGRYSGVFELTIVSTVSVKAIAIISTKLPDGQPGFALLILITAEGFTPIQLGLGFSLTGIGGLLALNRTINVDAVRNGLRDGVLDSILFVKNPVKNAPRIISTLNQVFPIASGRLMIGPLAEISWGARPLVKIRLALLLDIPQPVKVVLLAQLRMVLPDEKNPVVELNVDAVGVLDFGRCELALDASIHHSRLLKFALSGDMALRLNWGKEPSFLISVGGFHPKYPPPQGLRPLERLTLTLSDSENPRIRFETYLALTSNSIQMGARVSVYAEAGGFGVDGGGSFDALIQWAPFSLEISFQAWVRVFSPIGTLAGIRLALAVTGPDPWHVAGVAELTVLFVTVQVSVDFRLGEAGSQPDPVESVDVGGQIWAELRRPASWQPVLPPGIGPGVTLAEPISPEGGATTALVVHPLATVTGRQRVAPLDRPIARVGAARPTAGVRTYPLTVTVASGVRVDPVKDLFAPAQYADLADDAKLTAPAFAPMQAGAVISGAVAARHPEHGIAASDLMLETLDVTQLETDPVGSTPIPPIAPNGRQPNELRDAARLAGAQAGLIS
jgi:hypothetical protein